MVGMKNASNPRRGRSRGGNGGKRHQPSRNQAHDSSGPDGKVRGSAQQVYDKYLSLARDATSAGEHIAAEGYYQFAEHYYRVANADGANNQTQNRAQQGQQASDNQSQNDQPEGNVRSANTAKPEDTAQPVNTAKSVDTDQQNVVAVDDSGADKNVRRRRPLRKAPSAPDTGSDNPSDTPPDITVADSDDSGNTLKVSSGADAVNESKSVDDESGDKDDLAASA